MRRDLKGLMFAIAGAAIFGVASARAADCGDSANGFDDWLASFKQVAIRDGVSPQVVDEALNGVVFDPSVVCARSRPGIRAEFRRVRRASPHSEPDQEGQDDAPCLCGTVPENRTALWRARAGPGRDLGARDRLWRRHGRHSDLQRARDARLRLPPCANLSRRACRCAHDRPARARCGPDRCAAPGPARSARPSSCRRPISKYAVNVEGGGGGDLLPAPPTLWRRPRISCARHGWTPGARWDEGQPNFAALLEWNSAPGLRQDNRAVRGQAGGARVRSASRARPRSTCGGPTVASENHKSRAKMRRGLHSQVAMAAAAELGYGLA